MREALIELLRSGYLLREEATGIVSTRPVTVELRPSWRCNARCRHCGIWHYASVEELPLARMLDIVDQLSDLGTKVLYITGGEPFLYRGLNEVVKKACGLQLKVRIITNGFRLDAVRARQLMQWGVEQVTLSIDHPDPNIHDAVRGAKGLWAIAISALRELRRARGATKKPLLRINAVVMNGTLRGLEGFFDWKDLPDEICLIPISVDVDWVMSLRNEKSWHHWAETILSEKLSAATWNHFRSWEYPRLQELARSVGVMLSLADIDNAADCFLTKGGHWLGCFVPWVHMVIQPDGTIYPCCYCQSPGHCLGSLNNHSVASMWNGPLYQELRCQLLERPMPCCSRCSRYYDFNATARKYLGKLPEMQ